MRIDDERLWLLRSVKVCEIEREKRTNRSGASHEEWSDGRQLRFPLLSCVWVWCCCQSIKVLFVYVVGSTFDLKGCLLSLLTTAWDQQLPTTPCNFSKYDWGIKFLPRALVLSSLHSNSFALKEWKAFSWKFSKHLKTQLNLSRGWS